jgi:putative transposase
MPRRNLIRTNLFPYHVTSRSHNRDWFSIPIADVWSICLSAFELAWEKSPVVVHAFVLMDNHYHLVVTTPDSNIDTFMKHFNKTISEKMKIRSGAVNQKFGGRYKWCIIENQNYYYYNVMRYVFRNPISVNLVQRVEDYPFSTVNEKEINLTTKVKVKMNMEEDYQILINFFN